MAKMSQEVMDAFKSPKSIKVLATAGSVSEIDAVPKGTMTAIDDETIAFADICGNKTNQNLEANKKASALAMSMAPMAGYQVKGTFQGFQTSGALFDKFAQEVKTALKLGIKGVGTIKVDEVYTVAPPTPGKKIA